MFPCVDLCIGVQCPWKSERVMMDPALLSCCEPPDMGSEEKTLGVLWKSSKHSSLLSSPPAPSLTLVSLNYRQSYNTCHIISVVEIL